MERPPLKYNQKIYEHIRTLPRAKKPYMMCDLEKISEGGATGVAFTAYVKPKQDFPEQVVLKQHKRSVHCTNEFECLKYLRDKMLAGELPAYYIFLYGCFTSGSCRYLILEKADKHIFQHFVDYNLSVKIYLQTFWQVADAVSYLEAVKLNHGDLWEENVMLNWNPDQHDIPEEERSFTIKIIDFDAAFQPGSTIKNPNYGGAENYRTKFIIGYDLSRFFDALIFNYEDCVEKKKLYKKELMQKERRAKKRKNPPVPKTETEIDAQVEEEFYENATYPQEIIDFMYSLKPNDPDHFEHCERMSGKSVCAMIVKFAEQLGVSLF
jgi:serine/threonine protein kinase